MWIICTVAAEIFVCIKFKVRSLVAHENHAHVVCDTTQAVRASESSQEYGIFTRTKISVITADYIP